VGRSRGCEVDSGQAGLPDGGVGGGGVWVGVGLMREWQPAVPHGGGGGGGGGRPGAVRVGGGAGARRGA